MSTVQTFHLPDLFTGCPLEARLSPHQARATEESRAWVKSFRPFSDSTQAEFTEAYLELLASYIYWYTDYEQFRTTCDFMNVFTVFDDYTDVQSGKDAHISAFNFSQAMRHPNWDDDTIISRMTAEFRARTARLAGPNNLRRLIDIWEEAANSVAKEAEFRERGEFFSLKDYTPHRRYNAGTMTCLALVEYALGLDLPNDVYEHPAVSKAFYAACDHAWHVNDLCSYNREQAKGVDGNNIVTLLMQERNMTLQEACDEIGVRCQKFVDDYLSARDEIGEILGRDVSRLIEGIGHFLVGFMTWCFVTPRYFGPGHHEVKRTLMVELRPKEVPTKAQEVPAISQEMPKGVVF